jgi:hypothetical protein
MRRAFYFSLAMIVSTIAVNLSASDAWAFGHHRCRRACRPCVQQSCGGCGSGTAPANVPTPDDGAMNAPPPAPASDAAPPPPAPAPAK